MIKGQAPGTILQFMFIRNRLKRIVKKSSTFIEVGSGNGFLSNLLLKQGYIGTGVDLNSSACENNLTLNQNFIDQKKYFILNADFNSQSENNFDFLICAMVIEHINDTELKVFLDKAKKSIKPNGRLIFLVPSNMHAWGIEDVIAGHVKRYSFSEIQIMALNNELNVEFKCGLNYPISNWLLKLSNRIVNKNERYLITKSEHERTVYTGNRNVKFKTVFPKYFNVILNEIVLYPFYLLQLINYKNEKSLIMYFELSLKSKS